MTRWVRSAGSAIYGTPLVITALFMTLMAWLGVAEIYAAMLQVPHRGESGALMLGTVDGLGAAGLFFSYLNFARDLRELRVPGQRPFLAVALACIGAFVFLAPCVLVWSLNGGFQDLAIVATGSILGTGAALLWGSRSATPASLSAQQPAATVRSPGPGNSPWRAVRTALGPPVAPASWQRRLIQSVSLCVLVAGTPALVEVFKASMSDWTLIRVLQYVTLLPAIAVCWLWPLSSVNALFMARDGALTELALLPGMGTGQQQLRRLFWVALGVPTGALLALLAVELIVATLEHLPHAVVTKLIVSFFLIPLITLPIMTAQVLKPQVLKPRAHKTWSGSFFLFTQIWVFTLMVWTGSWDVLIAITPRWLMGAVALGAVSFVVGTTAYSLRKLSFRPHPFVDVSG